MNMEVDQDYRRIYEELKKLPEFDEEAFKTLTDDTDQQVLLKILARFWITVKESLDQIDEGLKEDSGDAIWRACHKVAGSAELLGFKDFGSHSRSLNMSLKTMTDPHIHMSEISNYLEEGQKLLKLIDSIFPNLKSYL